MLVVTSPFGLAAKTNLWHVIARAINPSHHSSRNISIHPAPERTRNIMAPLRRYLRITKHSVLEVRIYLDRPADADAWLLKRDNPALPRVIQAVRPLVLPKLREENERGKGKGGAKTKKKGVKDVVVEGESMENYLARNLLFARGKR
jgi:hypothetical protein